MKLVHNFRNDHRAVSKCVVVPIGQDYVILQFTIRVATTYCDPNSYISAVTLIKLSLTIKQCSQ